jgi:hypothetical protein
MHIELLAHAVSTCVFAGGLGTERSSCMAVEVSGSRRSGHSGLWQPITGWNPNMPVVMA